MSGDQPLLLCALGQAMLAGQWGWREPGAPGQCGLSEQQLDGWAPGGGTRIFTYISVKPSYNLERHSYPCFTDEAMRGLGLRP